jgi:predicted Zn-ribbon and HTH transcriptional regulator
MVKLGMIQRNQDELPKCICADCGYEWVKRSNNPKRCPKCFSRDWNLEPIMPVILANEMKGRVIV